ncbi:MAG: glycogen/starch synthase [Muribaculaceae bacterium]|nr:glycogen/starch synthase [Muribaculaceae bacterium]
MSNKVLYISQEITPYLPANHMSTIGQNLPQAAQSNGYEVRIFMPKYGTINERRNQLHEVIRLSGMNVIIDDTDHPLIIKVATLQPSRMQVYFIDSDDYFIHKSLDDLELRLYPEENDERLMFFAYGVIETVKKLRWEPEIIHCQGWASALAPLYIKTLYAEDPMFKNAKIVYSLYGDEFEGTLNERFYDKLQQAGIPQDVVDRLKGINVDHETLSRLAIDFADKVVVSSPRASQALIDYARSQNKLAMEYPGDDTGYEPYIRLYDEQIGK